jgi:hypothetical protein
LREELSISTSNTTPTIIIVMVVVIIILIIIIIILIMCGTRYLSTWFKPEQIVKTDPIGKDKWDDDDENHPARQKTMRLLDADVCTYVPPVLTRGFCLTVREDGNHFLPVTLPSSDTVHFYFRACGPSFFLILCDTDKVQKASNVMLFFETPIGGSPGLVYVVRDQWSLGHDVIRSNLRNPTIEMASSHHLNWFASPTEVVEYHVVFRALPGDKVQEAAGILLVALRLTII